MTERQVQTAAIKTLRDLGHIVHTTSDNRRSHHTKGLADAFVSIGHGLWKGMEFKSPTGKVSKEQEELARKGNVVICRSVQEAIDAVERADRLLNYP